MTQRGAGRRGCAARATIACHHYSLLSDKATAFVAVVAAGAAVAAFALPLRLYIVGAIAAAVCVGVLIDGGGDFRQRVLARRRRRGSPPLSGNARPEEVVG